MGAKQTRLSCVLVVPLNPDKPSKIAAALTDPNQGQRTVRLSELLEEKPLETRPPVGGPVPEIGGRSNGPEPTRYGDWEKDGRCIDF